jgi:hypothetical protein
LRLINAICGNKKFSFLQSMLHWALTPHGGSTRLTQEWVLGHSHSWASSLCPNIIKEKSSKVGETNTKELSTQWGQIFPWK